MKQVGRFNALELEVRFPLALRRLATIGFVATLLLNAAASTGPRLGDLGFDTYPKGNKVVFSAWDGGLWLFDIQRGLTSKLPISLNNASSPRFAPDGRRVVFSSKAIDGSYSLYSFDLGTRSTRRLTSAGRCEDRCSDFSHDGKTLIVLRAARVRPYSMGGYVWDDYDLYVLNLKSLTTTRLTSEHYYSCGSAAFVGADIVFSAVQRGGFDATGRLFEIKPGSKRVVLFHDQKGPDWTNVAASHTGERIAFVWDKDNKYTYDIFLSTPTGGTVHKLPTGAVTRFCRVPRFSSDDKEIYYLGSATGGRQKPYSLYKVDLKGNVNLVATDDLFMNPESWSRRKGNRK